MLIALLGFAGERVPRRTAALLANAAMLVAFAFAVIVFFKLRDLPDDTRVYCGHEYTLANIKFAQTIEPNNAALAARAKEAAAQIAAGKPTIPTTIAEEKAANVFLRADDAAVAAAVGLAGKPAAQVFAEVRARKNKF